MAEIPYRYAPDNKIENLVEKHSGLEAGQETSDVVTVAGRLMLRRVQGKLAFGTLDDGSGRIQLFAPSKVTPDFEDFCSLKSPSWIWEEPFRVGSDFYFDPIRQAHCFG